MQFHYSTGSRVTVDGINCVVIVTDTNGQPVTVKADPTNTIFEINGNHKISPIIQPPIELPKPKNKDGQ